MRRYLLFLLLGVLLGLAIIAVFFLSTPYTLRGSSYVPAVPASDFTLTAGDGSPWRLSDQKGKVVLMFFGYTTCPDVCPATLGELQQVRERLGEKRASDVQVVFITVDPERDVPERIGPYVSAFDPSFVALSGSEADLQPVWAAYGIYREIRPNASGSGYLVDHTARTFLIDRSGNLRSSYVFGTPVDDFVSDLKFVLKDRVEEP